MSKFKLNPFTKKLDYFNGNTKVIGTVLSQDFSTDTSLDNVTAVGNLSIAATDGVLRITRNATGAGGASNDYVRIEKNICVESYRIKIRLKTTQYSTTTFGPFFGAQKTRLVGALQWLLLMDSDNANNGSLFEYADNTLAAATKLTSSIGTVAANDIWEIVLTRNRTTLTVSFKNETTGRIASQTRITNISGASNDTTPFKPCIYLPVASSTQDLLSFQIDYLEPVGVDFVVIGDSRSAGNRATLEQNRFQDVLFKKLNITNWASFVMPSAGSRDFINNIEEIKSCNAKYAILWTDVNDLAQGLTVTQLQDNIISIFSDLYSVGTIPILIGSLPWNGNANYATLRDWALTTLQAINSEYIIVDTWSTFEDKASALNLDATFVDNGVHLNDLGYRTLAGLIYSRIADKMFK